MTRDSVVCKINICANNNNFLSLYMIYIMIISYSSGNMQLRGACTHIFPYSSWQLGIQSVIPHTTRRIAYVPCTYDMYIYIYIYIYILYTVLLYVRISYIIPVCTCIMYHTTTTTAPTCATCTSYGIFTINNVP